jgi:ribosomal protein S18 acetylase RimI-like enzyme
MNSLTIRQIRREEYSVLEDFLYPAVRFYERLGYEIIRERIDHAS